MPLLCSSIPLITAHSDLQTDVECALHNHLINLPTIDPFLGFLCVGTGDLVSEFCAGTSNAY
jgi:hypothetical protein